MKYTHKNLAPTPINSNLIDPRSRRNAWRHGNEPSPLQRALLPFLKGRHDRDNGDTNLRRDCRSTLAEGPDLEFC